MELAKEHNVFIGKEVFEFFEKYFLDARNYSDCVILTDVNVAEKCLPLLYENVPVTENVPVIVLPDGEENKNIQTCIHIWNTWLEHEYDRNVLVVVLGGGMVCDLGAFCASVYKRGVDYVLFPTTLMAQCDAAIGGKNGVNFKHYKNQLGTYQLPEAVFIYPEFLRTLSKRQMINGFAEMIKHALIQDPGYWHFLQTMPLGEFEKLQQAILFSVKIKQKIVSGDFLDRGMRQALNFGHTVGHALETLAIEKKADIYHGEAVAAGMIMELYFSYKFCGLEWDTLNEVAVFIAQLYPFIELDENDLIRLYEIIKKDKKNNNGQIRLSLIEAIGFPVTGVTVKDFELFVEAYAYYLNVYGK